MLFLLSFAINAQPKGQERMHGQHPPIPDSAQVEKIVNDLTKELSLSEEQKVKIKYLFNDHFSEVRSKMEADKKEREKHRQEMEILKKEFETSVNALLTKEQQLKFDEHRKKHHKKGGKRPKKGK